LMYWFFYFTDFFAKQGARRSRYHPPASKRTYFVINRIITKTQSDCHIVSFIGQQRNLFDRVCIFHTTKGHDFEP